MVYPHYWLSACVLPILAGSTAAVPLPVSLSLSRPLLHCVYSFSLGLLTASPSTSSQTFSAHFATRSAACRIENKPWLHLKLLTESTPLDFLGITFPESLCFKSCFDLCLDTSTVYSINNPLESCVFGSAVIGLCYNNLQHCFYTMLFWEPIQDKTGRYFSWMAFGDYIFHFQLVFWGILRGRALAARWSMDLIWAESMSVPHVLLSRKKLVLLRH